MKVHSSRRYSLHLERSTSVGDIGSSFNSGFCIDDDYIPMVTKKKFQRQPVIRKPSQVTNTESKDSKLAERSNGKRPSQNSGNLLKEAAPATVERSSHALAANSLSKDEKKHSTRPRSLVIKGLFFIGSPERELSAMKKTEKDGELGLFGEFIKKCTLCKKEFKSDEDVYMYIDRPFCSSGCRDDRIALDGFNRKDFGLGKEDQKTMKSLRKDLNQLQMYL